MGICVEIRDTYSQVHKTKLMCYAVATISRLLKVIGLFCKRALLKRLYSAKRPIILRSLLIVATPYVYTGTYWYVYMHARLCLCRCVCVYVYMNINVCTCMCECIHVHIWIYIYAYIYIYIFVWLSCIPGIHA